ncbi:hypothetical protein [Sphingomonas sp.]|uniref:hypothetical protein n=1 Tax=Sphingomonas sp. TaxID=28214 RepID=UPI0017BDAB1D|nr:hypothetical protein [Sphingomonas sp.]MBA4763672.1 hypothetical protein [Sphingomonas sp.]
MIADAGMLQTVHWITRWVALAGIAAIRMFLSLSLEVEIEGNWPWQRANGG